MTARPAARWWAAALGVAVSGLDGCKAGNGRTDVQRRSECTTDSWALSATCTQTVETIEGEVYRDELAADFIKQASSVRLEGTAEVRDGAVRIWFEDAEGDRHEVTVRPGAPTHLEGHPRTEGQSSRRYFALYYQPMPASGPAQAAGLVVRVAFDVKAP